MRVPRHAAFDDPLFYLAAYGVEREWFVWLVARGGLQDWRARPVSEADFGDEASRALARRAFPRLRIERAPALR